LLQSREEQDLNFWKEVAIAFVENKYNTETSRKKYPINMFQGGSPHEPYCYDRHLLDSIWIWAKGK